MSALEKKIKQMGSIKKRIKEIKILIVNYEASIKDVEEEIDILNKDISMLKRLKENVMKEIKTDWQKQKQVDNLHKEIAAITEKLNTKQTELLGLKNKVRALRLELNKQSSSLDTLHLPENRKFDAISSYKDEELEEDLNKLIKDYKDAEQEEDLQKLEAETSTPPIEPTASEVSDTKTKKITPEEMELSDLSKTRSTPEELEPPEEELLEEPRGAPKLLQPTGFSETLKQVAGKETTTLDKNVCQNIFINSSKLNKSHFFPSEFPKLTKMKSITVSNKKGGRRKSRKKRKIKNKSKR